MSLTKAALARRAAQPAPPDYRLDRNVLLRVLYALPPPSGAAVAGRHAYLCRIISELCALAPGDALEAMAACHIVAARHSAADSARLSLDRASDTTQAARWRRNAEKLLWAADRAERTLRRAQAGRLPGNQVPPEIQFDLAELDAYWCDAHPMKPEAVIAGAPASPPVSPRATQQSAARPAPAVWPKFTLCGKRVDLVQLATMPAAGTA
jgi:hypothetical protein